MIRTHATIARANRLALSLSVLFASSPTAWSSESPKETLTVLHSTDAPEPAREQSLLAVLMIMEKSMQGHLAFVLKRHGQEWNQRVYAEEAEVFARGLAPRFGKLPRHEFNVGFEQAVPAYLTKYKLLHDKSPAQDREIMDLFVEHKQAWLTSASPSWSRSTRTKRRWVRFGGRSRSRSASLSRRKPAPKRFATRTAP